MKEEHTWDTHWKKIHGRSLFGLAASIYRKLIIANAVRHFTEKYFARSGQFVEAGSGTSQTSLRLKRHKREYIAVDISAQALKQASKIPQISKTVKADIRSMPFKANSIAGIWNLGVMEHFYEKDIIAILNEFHRILQKGGVVLLFWPPVFGSTEIGLGAVEKITNIFRKKKFHFFPDEVTRLQSFRHAQRIINKSKLRFVKAHFTWHDAFTHVVVVCKK